MPAVSAQNALVTIAKADLAARLSVSVEQIDLAEVRSVTWPDTSIGCAETGKVYAQIPQAGLLIRLKVGDRMFFYHSTESQAPFLCENTTRMLLELTPKSDEFVPPPDSEID